MSVSNLRMRLTLGILVALAGVSLLALQAPATSDPAGQLRAIVDEYWERQLDANLPLHAKYRGRVEKLPEISLERATADADYAGAVVKRLEAIQSAQLPHSDWLTWSVLRWEAVNAAEAAKYYWLRFLVTPYSSPLFDVLQTFRTYALKTADDLEAYLRLLRQVSGYVGRVEAHLKGQSERRIRLPVPQLDAVVTYMRSYMGTVELSPFNVDPARLGAFDEARRKTFRAEVGAIVTGEINPAFEGIIRLLVGEYRKAAPEALGIGQYPGGRDYYRYLVRVHSTLEMTPEEVHRIGQEEVARIEARMDEVRALVKFEGDRAAFHRTLQKDARFIPKAADEIGKRLLVQAERMRPRVPDYFGLTPKAPYGVKRLDSLLEGSMTYGFYQAPTPTDPTGYYLYNGSDLSQRSLVTAAALAFHELVPGHHFQLALQTEQQGLPPYRREARHTAFTEGWGVYASLVAEDMGMYKDPYDLYGMLAMDALVATRLVVDTAMNDLSWARGRAAAYMQEHTLESGVQIGTETLRYGADIPGQALAYKIGARKLLELRDRMRKELGRDFEMRKFHDTVLASGSMPLSVLEKHLDWVIAESRRAKPVKK